MNYYQHGRTLDFQHLVLNFGIHRKFGYMVNQISSSSRLGYLYHFVPSALKSRVYSYYSGTRDVEYEVVFGGMGGAGVAAAAGAGAAAHV